jgi:hypothetical protein
MSIDSKNISSEELTQYILIADFTPDLHNYEPKIHALCSQQLVGGMPGTTIVGSKTLSDALPIGGLTATSSEHNTQRIEKKLSLLKLYIGLQEHNQVISTEKLNEYDKALWEWAGSGEASFYTNHRIGVIKITTTFSELEDSIV